MRMAPTDIADVTGHHYTYLMNGQGPETGWYGLFTPGERVRLRVINAAAMSYFNLRIPGLPMTVVQTDGQNVEPVTVVELQIVTFVQADRMEGRASEADRGYLLDLQGWVGTDASKFWAKIEGDGVVGGALEELDVQALYSRMIGSFFDLQLGVRQDALAYEPRWYGRLRAGRRRGSSRDVGGSGPPPVVLRDVRRPRACSSTRTPIEGLTTAARAGTTTRFRPGMRVWSIPARCIRPCAKKTSSVLTQRFRRPFQMSA